jgi:hypothetical protein
MVPRTPAHPRCACNPRLRATRAVAVAAIVLGVLSVGSTVDAVSSSTTPAAPAVRLLTQSPFLHSSGGVLRLVLTRSGPLAAANPDATVQLTLFARLTTRFGLEGALGSPGPQVPIDSTRALQAHCLASARTVRVLAGIAPTGGPIKVPTQCGGAAPVLELDCAIGCDGVYPLQITARGGGTVDSLVTLVTIAANSSTPLHVAWMLRVAGRRHGLGASSAAMAAVASHPRVPVTVDAQGIAIAHGLTEPGGPSAAAILGAAVTSRVHELIAESYVPADLGALFASNLHTEVAGQFALSDLALRDAGITAAEDHSVTFGSGPQTPTSVQAIASAGVHRLVLNGSALEADPTDLLTWGAAFNVLGATGTVAALASDTELSTLSDQAARDPGLVANQLLGELAFLHFEQPNLAQPRVVVVVTNATAQVTGSFVDDVLAGLTANPVLLPVTVSGAFASDPVGANGFPDVRGLLDGPSQPWPAAIVKTIRFLRTTTVALGTAVTGGATPIPAIDGMLLEAERPLTTQRRATLLTRVHQALKDQLGYFRIYSGPITLTSSGATTIPITVLSSAPYSVQGVLELSSPRITFRHPSLPFVLNSSVNSVRVPARALVNGDLPLSVKLIAPDGNIVLARAMITVRVTGFSGVGLALTVLAVVVLAAWWIRTHRRRRAAR